MRYIVTVQEQFVDQSIVQAAPSLRVQTKGELSLGVFNKKTKKEALVQAAEEFGMNIFYLKAYGIAEDSLSEQLIRTMASQYLDQYYHSTHREEDVDSVVEVIKNEEQLWHLIHGVVLSTVHETMQRQNVSLDQYKKGMLIDKRV